MAEEHRSKTLQGFARQAGRFARSPLHRDPVRLNRLLDFVAPRPGERVLDAACGPGIVVAGLAGRGARAIGVDLTAEMLNEARRGGQGDYVRGDATRLPIRDGAVDVVVSRNALHHLQDPAVAIAEMARIVRPGGRVIIEDMQAPSDPEQRGYHETIETLRDMTHVRTMTLEEIGALAEQSGLREPRRMTARFEIEFDEWIDRADPPPANRQQARSMVEACVDADLSGLKVWRDAGRLRFERLSMLFGAVRPQ